MYHFIPILWLEFFPHLFSPIYIFSPHSSLYIVYSKPTYIENVLTHPLFLTPPSPPHIDLAAPWEKEGRLSLYHRRYESLISIYELLNSKPYILSMWKAVMKFQRWKHCYYLTLKLNFQVNFLFITLFSITQLLHR